MRIKILLILLLSSFFSKAQDLVDFSALPHNNLLKTRLDSIVHTSAADFFAKTNAPGVVLNVYQNGATYFYTYGYANKEKQQLFTDTTLLEIGSITKTFTASIILKMQQDGILNIDQPLTSFFPEATLENPALQKITLRQILSHTAGLPRLPANIARVKNYSFLQPYEYYAEEKLLDCLKKLKLDSVGKYEYSNLGYGILGTIAQKKSGKSLEELFKENIFGPLGMNHSSTVDPSENVVKASGYMNNKPAAYWKFDCLAGAGAIKSTPGDMLRYLEACMGKTTNNDFQTVIKQAILPSLEISKSLSIGMSWHIMTSRTPNIFWHNGGTYGFSTFAAFEPITQTAIFAATNAFNTNEALEKLSGRVMISLIKK